MDEIKNQDEERKHKCFSDYCDAAVMLIYRLWSKSGLITEICGDWLVFRYLDLKIAPEEVPPDCAELKIHWESRGLSIENMPCRVIEDYDASPEYAFSLVPMRKCRVAFGELAPGQAAQLDQVIAQFAGRQPGNFKG